ncbi:MAG: AAA family ATPase [Prevotella sp.]|nr:AAA family ATPase [Prevotella sp.]
MKIQKLEIYNIASIEKATIDFTAQPLCDSDVFLITGNTGAGKTTILDSICLALFNNTPRLTKGKDKTVRNGIDELTLKDPRRMMRRNTGEASVELYFEANRADYVVEWHVQRGRKKKPTVKMDTVNRKLTNLTTKKVITGIGTKDKELQDEIQAVIGLDFSQFCRTTMLAQNEFTKFLASDEDERAEILEKITKTTEFSVVGSKIFEITSQKKVEWQNAQQAVSNTGLSDAEVKQKQDELVGLHADYKLKKVERDTADVKKKWLEQDAIFGNDEKKAQTDYDNVSKRLEGDEYKQSFAFAQQWNDTIEARQWLSRQHEAEQNVKEQEKQLNIQKQRFGVVLGGYQYEANRLQSLRTELAELTSFLDANADRRDTFDKVQTVVAHLNTIIAKTRNTGELNQNLQKSERRLAETLIPQQQDAEKIVTEAEQEVGALKDAILKKQAELDGLNLHSLRRERDEVKEMLGNLKQAMEAVADIDAKKAVRSQEAQRIEQLRSAIASKENELSERLLPAYEAALKTKEAAELSRDMLRKSVDEFAKQMRTHLKVGCECPVCRQKVETLPLENEIDAMYAEAERYYEAAKKALSDAESAKNKAEAGIKSEKKRYNEDQKRYDEDRSVADAEKKATDYCLRCGITSLTEHVVDDLRDRQTAGTTRLTAELEPTIAAAEAIEKTLKQLQLHSNEATEKLSKKEKALRAASKKVDDCQAEIKGYRNSLLQNENDRRMAVESVEPLIVSASWQYDWTSEPEKFINDLQSSCDAYLKKKKRREEVERQSELLQKTLDDVSAMIVQIRQTNDAWSDVAQVEGRPLENLLMQCSNVLQEVGVIVSSLRNARAMLQETRASLGEFVEKHPELTMDRLEELNQTTTIKELTDRLEAQRQDKEHKKALLERAQKVRQQHQTEKPLMAPTDTYQSVVADFSRAEQDLVRLNQQIGVLNNDLAKDEQLKKGLDALVSKEKAAWAEYDKWNRLNRLIGDKEGKTFRNIAQSFIFDGLLHSANSYLQRLEPRYTLKTVDGTLYSSLEDAYQGFSSRDTGSLSGGESFLVSLALALALSDIGQGLAVDTLFIDEGFGSLSGQPLANAINTLRSLRGTNGRHVGIISHIQEVRDNIPVQIQVNKSPMSSSSIVEVV